ncbi:MAG: hypothetical protein K0S51_395 [Bacillales bacterium]|jgi:uncharacterized protein YpmB|nr:hypothetical protein [Bacillales bacterium]
MLKRKANILIESIVCFTIVAFICLTLAPLISNLTLKRQENVKRIILAKAKRTSNLYQNSNLNSYSQKEVQYVLNHYEKKR